jgi:hypothetical protein
VAGADRAAGRPRATGRRRPLRDESGAVTRHRARRRQLHPRQGEPDRD